jgi:ketopantoate reductase
MLVVGNNLGDYAAQAALIDPERFLLGFGVFGGYREGGTIVYLDGRTKEKPDLKGQGETLVGVLSPAARPAMEAIREILQGAGLPTRESPDIAAWLVCHAALVFPLAGSMYAAGGDQARYCRTRDAILLGIRACREAFASMRALGWRLEPPSLRFLRGMPEWILAPLLAKRLADESARVAMFGHANAPSGREEIGGQAAVLDALLRASGRPMPAWDRLLPYFGKGACPP